MLNIVVLAAGKGTRMKSSLPKVLHPVAGKPLLGHVLDTSRELASGETINVVIGHGAELVEERLAADDIRFIMQAEQLGTGHAVQQALPYFDAEATVLILYGDVPLIKRETLDSLVSKVSEQSLGLLTLNLENPTGYGRIERNDDGDVIAIVEQKDANEAQLRINEVNTGVMAVFGKHLQEWLPKLSNDNAQGEYYLTDIIALAQQSGIAIETEQPNAEWEVLGVNNRAQQAELERFYQQDRAQQLMTDGLTLLDPNRFDVRGSLSVGQDVVIDVNCVFEGEVTLGNGVSIGPNCVIKNATIGDNSTVKAHSMLEDANLAAQCEVGPYARLRPGATLKDGAKVGNFVEIKKTTMGVGSKANHLTYLGDATIGDGVNIGAGTITCNYDGVNKFQTEISDGAFIGSNTALVAPVKVGTNATVGAGSTVNSDVPDKHLAVARSKQRNIDGWQRPEKKK
ncbi:bifunctional UDP-N-acetylglucosamine diphosphorylase/glucosamine-1-phosphate N-acetyltransferase GlmU [Aurantivibrio plasticivorans]